MICAFTTITALVATVLLPASVAAQGAGGRAAAIQDWLKGYDTAFNEKDLVKLGSFYHPDVTIFEGGGVDRGWTAYRDHHLGPELKAFEDLRFGHSNVQVQMITERAAYVTSEYSLKATVKGREVDTGGLETLIVIRMDDGSWKIRHSHTSSRRRSQG